MELCERSLRLATGVLLNAPRLSEEDPHQARRSRGELETMPAHLPEAVRDPRQREVALDKAAGGAHQQGVPLLDAVGTLGQQGCTEKSEEWGTHAMMIPTLLRRGAHAPGNSRARRGAAHPTPALTGSKSAVNGSIVSFIVS